MASFHLHVAVFKASTCDMVDLLRRHHAERFDEVTATSEEREQLVYEVGCHDGPTIEKHWRRFEVCPLEGGLTAVWFMHRVDYPDDYFGGEVAGLSKQVDGDVYYVWERHWDEGYEVYRGGDCVNSVVGLTHAAEVTIDGETRHWTRRDGDPVEKHSQVPKRIRDRVKIHSDAPCEQVLLLGKGMANIEEFLTLVREEMHRGRRGCLVDGLVGMAMAAVLSLVLGPALFVSRLLTLNDSGEVEVAPEVVGNMGQESLSRPRSWRRMARMVAGSWSSKSSGVRRGR